MTLIILVALLFLAGLLYFEKTSNTIGLLLTKPFVSILFVLTAIIQTHVSQIFYQTILVGLILCLIGDVCLIFMDSKKMFLFGLIAFLSGHVAYIVSFSYFFKLSMATLIAILFFCAVALVVYHWLKPNLGSMKGPVIAYITIITMMIIGAVSVFDVATLPLPGRQLIISGALLFFLSDLFVARNKFIKNEYLNRLIGLPLYFTGQYLIAFSVGYLG